MKLQEYTSSKGNFEECMKCTVCTAYCPVLQVNPLYPGPKQAGPDGERLRLKDPYFFNKALKYCMNCKRCEVACPSGVHVAMIPFGHAAFHPEESVCFGETPVPVDKDYWRVAPATPQML